MYHVFESIFKNFHPFTFVGDIVIFGKITPHSIEGI